MGIIPPVPPSQEDYACLPRDVDADQLRDIGEPHGPDDTDEDFLTRHLFARVRVCFDSRVITHTCLATVN